MAYIEAANSGSVPPPPGAAAHRPRGPLRAGGGPERAGTDGSRPMGSPATPEPQRRPGPAADAVLPDPAAELPRAMARRELRLVYQPVFSAAGRAVGAEALLRWDHPVHGELRPAAFLGGLGAPLLGELAAWTAGEAVQQLTAWRRAGAMPGRLSLNVPASALEPGFALGLIALLRAERLPGAALALELSDAEAMPADGLLPKVLGELAAHGVVCLIDDFGRGASLMDTGRLPLRGLKLDGALSAHLPEGRREAGLARAYAAVGRALGVPVGAKHVETPAQRRFYLDLGVDSLQGDGLAAPVGAEALPGYFA